MQTCRLTGQVLIQSLDSKPQPQMPIATAETELTPLPHHKQSQKYQIIWNEN